MDKKRVVYLDASGRSLEAGEWRMIEGRVSMVLWRQKHLETPLRAIISRSQLTVTP